jgi:TM2 domain-containing membrane protein YozV
VGDGGGELSAKKAGTFLAWLGTLGPLGIHRFYLGRWITGGLAGGLFVALLVWSGVGVVGLFRDLFGDGRGGPGVVDVVARLGLTLVWGLWPGIDLWLLSTGRMRDRHGRILER